MPGINFAFGFGNHFTFAFNLQLGLAPSFKYDPVQQRVSFAHLRTTNEADASSNDANHAATQTPVTTSHRQIQYEASPDDQLLSSLESVSNFQDPMDQNTEHHAGNTLVASNLDPVLVHAISRTPSVTDSATTTLTPIPQTPRTAIRTEPPYVHRPKPQSRYRSLYGDSPYQRYLQTRTVGPRRRLPSVKPVSKQLPSPPESDTPGTPCKKPLSFQTLPLEIKNMIYSELLVSALPIKKPHKLVCKKKSIMLDSTHPVKDIDSAILCVCRTIYNEALPVLYGKNTFEFCKPRKLRDFSHTGLDKRLTTHVTLLQILRLIVVPHTEFGFCEAEAGRFTLIRSIILRLGHDRKPYIWQHNAPRAPDRKKIWSHWYQYFFNESDPRNEFDWGMFPCLSTNFPALDKLELDFSDWQLVEVDAIRVEPFITKFGRTGGLSALAIKGVHNKANLEQFRKELVKPGGMFTVKS
ncbi:MAG: hypothetical protein Q9181_001649 [Wetmoreana brouardii]